MSTAALADEQCDHVLATHCRVTADLGSAADAAPALVGGRADALAQRISAGDAGAARSAGAS